MTGNKPWDFGGDAEPDVLGGFFPLWDRGNVTNFAHKSVSFQQISEFFSGVVCFSNNKQFVFGADWDCDPPLGISCVQ